MALRRENFPGLPGEELSPDMPQPERPAIDFDQFRAFGSVPRMLGSQIDVPLESSIDQLALRRVTPTVMSEALFGASGGTAVKGLALGTEFHEAIVRNHDSFLASVSGKTNNANRLTPDPRAQEKQFRSQLGSLNSKHERHDKIIGTLESRQEVLTTLLDMQRTPGYHKRVSDVDVRMMATTAWTEVFGGMLTVLKDQRGLSNDEMIDMQQAMAFRLLGGPQSDRIANWGGMLRLGARYTGAVTSMFKYSLGQIEKNQTHLESDLETFYRENDISPLGTSAVKGIIEL